MKDLPKIKLLDNYQLYQLIHSDNIDLYTRKELETEYNNRNLSEFEKTRIHKKYQLNKAKLTSEIEKNSWNPLFTAFALNYHFRHLAVLKTHGKKKEAKAYMIALYLGLVLYFTLIIALILILQ